MPGRRAAIAALTLAGLADRPLPVRRASCRAKAKARADAIAELAGIRATLVFYESGPRLGDTLAALRDGLGNARRGGRSRDQQAARGMRHRHACRARGPLRRQAAQGRDRDRRRTARRARPRPATRSSTPRSTRRSRRLSPSRAAAEVAERLERPEEARLRPRARTARDEPRGSREARPRRRDARLLVASPPRLAHPRPARAGSRRRGRHRRAARPHPRFRRSQGAGDATTLQRCRSTPGGFAASSSPPSASRRATMKPGDDIRIDAIFIVPGRLPAPPREHLARVTKP